MTPGEVESFLSERADQIRGTVPLIRTAPVVYWFEGAYKVMRPEALNAHFFEMAGILRGWDVDRVEWELLERAERRNAGIRLDVLFRYVAASKIMGASELSYYLTRGASGWEVELVEVCRSPIWLKAHGRVEENARAPH